MNIAFFTDSYLPNVDGVVTSICNYRKELESRGHKVYVFSPGSKQQKENNKDPRVYYFTSTSFKPYPDYRIALFNFLAPVKLIKEYGIDIIHSHGIATTGLAAIRSSQKLGIPAVATFHTIVPNASHYITSNQQLQTVVHNIAWKYLTWYYSHYKKVIAPSNFAKGLLEERGVKNIVVHPSGINFNRYDTVFNSGGNEDVRKMFKIKKDEKIIIFIGRIALEKNLEEIVEASPTLLNKIPKLKIIIVGKGPALEHYKELVKKKGMEQYFLFTGYLEDDVLIKVYSVADVFVFPSKFDTQGLAVIEALATGVPAIVKENSAVSEYIENGKNGFVYSNNFDLVENIVKAIKNKNDMKKNANMSAKKFDIKETTEQLLNVYELLIKEEKIKTTHSL